MKSFFWHVVHLMSFLVATIAKADYHDASAATVRVRCPGGFGSASLGSGVVIGERNGNYIVMTNAHVADRDAATVQAFYRGHASAYMPAQRVWHAQMNGLDVAILRLPVGSLRGFAIKPIPIAENGRLLKSGQPVASIGCPHGNWPTCWTGHVTSGDGRHIEFVPPPENGRSGSPIFSEDFTRVVGLLAWRTGDEGRAMTSDFIRDAFAGNWGTPTGFDAESCEEVGLFKGPNGGAIRSAGRAIFGPRSGAVPPGRGGGRLDPNCPDGNCPLPGKRPDFIPGGGAFPTLPIDLLPEDLVPAPKEPPKTETAPAPAPVVKACECDHEALNKRLATMETALAKLLEPKPQPKPVQVSHYVVVGDEKDVNWPRIASHIENARQTFPAIRVALASQFSFSVRNAPIMVAYGLDGQPLAVKSGQSEVEFVLARLARGEVALR